MAAGSPESITRVAEHNFNLLLDQVGSMALTFERLNTYLDALEKQGRPRDATRVGIARCPTSRRARRARRRPPTGSAAPLLWFPGIERAA
jgi:hypothetical protein